MSKNKNGLTIKINRNFLLLITRRLLKFIAQKKVLPGAIAPPLTPAPKYASVAGSRCVTPSTRLIVNQPYTCYVLEIGRSDRFEGVREVFRAADRQNGGKQTGSLSEHRSENTFD